MNETILVVDDEASIADLVEVYLKNEGYRVLKCGNGRDALTQIHSAPPDLAILDVMLPDLDGFTLCKEIRTQYYFPILMLTAKVEDMDKITGLTLGADDYITNLFFPQDLLLPLQAVLRSVYPVSPAGARLGEIQIDWGKGTVCRNGAETALTAKEFALLKKLWDAQGNIVTIDALCSALWEGPLVGYENTLMVHIRRLREKIEPSPSHPQFLLTVRGLGYRLKREDTR